MLIGLSDDGVRACDVLARELLRPYGAASSVFPTPVRAVLATDDYAEARALSRAATDPPRAPSAQSFQLVKAIRSLDDVLGEPPAERVVEVHPELAFRALDPELRDAKESRYEKQSQSPAHRPRGRDTLCLLPARACQQ